MRKRLCADLQCAFCRSSFVRFSHTGPLVEFVVTDFPQNLSSELQRFAYNFFWGFIHSFSLDSFTTDSSRQKAAFHAHCIRAIGDAAHFFSPPAPNRIPAIEGGVFCAFKRWTCRKTCFWLRQKIHTCCLSLELDCLSAFSELLLVLKPI